VLKDPATGVFAKTVTVPGEGTYTVDPVTGKVTFDPLPTFTGPATPITYSVKDTGGASSTSTISLTVTPITPVAVNNTSTTPADTNVLVPLLANDSAGAVSAPLVPSSVKLLNPTTGVYGTSVTVPGEGTYTVDSAGVVTFDPLPSFAGVSTPVKYQVADANGTTVTATVSVTVFSPPVVLPDVGTTPQNVNVVIDPLLNDGPGSSGKPLDRTSVLLKDPATGVFAKTVTVPGEGTYTVDPVTGKVTFDPLPTFTGPATPVTYSVKDTDGVTSTSTIGVTVSPIVPVALDNAAGTPADTNVTVDVLANDAPGAASAPLNPASVMLKDPVTGVFAKTVTVPGEGTYTVDPVTGKVTFDPLPTFFGVATPLTYQVADTNGTTTTAKLAITVDPKGPTASPDTNVTAQGAPVTTPLLGNDVAGSTPLDPTTVKIKDPVTGIYGSTVVIPGEGTYAVQPDGSVKFTPNPGFVGVGTPISYQAKDTSGGTASSTLTITVTAVVPKAVDDAAKTPMDTNVIVDPLVNDSPGASGVLLDPTSVVLKDPATGLFAKTVTVPGEGTYTVDPATGKVTFDPLPTFTGPATPVSYQVKDANGTAVTAKIAITVDTAPVLTPDVGTTPQNVNVAIDPLLNDLPGTSGKPLDPASVVLKDPVTGVFAKTVTVPGEGTYTVDPVTGKVTFDPLPTFTGPAKSITYSVKDADGVSATSTITVTVAPITPKAVDDAKATPFDTNAVVDVLANDTAGASSASLDPTTVLLKDPATGVFVKSVTIPGEGTYTVDPVTGKVTFDPLPTFTGPATPVVYQVKDANGTAATAKILITVGVPPKAIPDTGLTLQNTNATVDVLANDDPSIPPLDPASVLLKDPVTGLFVKSVTIPGEGTYTVDPVTGKVTLDPVPTFTGAGTKLTYQVKDTDGVSVTSTLTITVTPITPKAIDDTAKTPADTNVTLGVLGNDAAGALSAALDPTTVLLKDPVTGVFAKSVTVPGEGTYTVDPATGKVTFDPVPTFTGKTSPLTYQVADTNGTSVTAKITVSVAGPPMAKPDTTITTHDTPVTVDLLTNDTPGATPLDPSTVLLKDPATGLFGKTVTIPGVGIYKIDPVTGKVTFDPLTTFTGKTPPLMYQVTDGGGKVVTSTLVVTVAPPGVPVGVPDTETGKPNRPTVVDPLSNDKPSTGGTFIPKTLHLVDPKTGKPVDKIVIPGKGTWTVKDGKVVFVPLPGFTGKVTTGYTVKDTNGQTTTSTITITIPGTPLDPPTPGPNPPASGGRGLAHTGSEVLNLLGAASLLVAAGTALMMGRRRRSGRLEQ
jgi:CshA-type fibril repeat protein